MLLQIVYLKVVLEHFRMSDHNPSSRPIDNSLSNTIIFSLKEYQVLT